MSEASIAFYIFILAGLHESVKPDNEAVTYKTIKTLKLSPVDVTPMSFTYGETSLVTFNYSVVNHNITMYPKKGFIVTVSVDDDNVASVEGHETYYIDYGKPTGNITIKVKGANAGRTQLRLHIQDWLAIPVAKSGLSPDKLISEQFNYVDVAFPVYVIMITRPIDVVFNIVVFLLVLTANIGMGTQVDLKIVKSQFRRPIAIGIGMFSQFVFMPLIAFFVAVALKVEPGIGLGLFACGCAPGGLASNIFTYMLHGNISLSITMTLVSTLASIGMLPLWLFTLGAYLYKKSDIYIPFLNIFVSLFIIIIPTVIGLFVQAKMPRLAAVLIKYTKFVLAIFIFFVFTVGTYANWWVLDLVDTTVLIASGALPYLGFIFGGLAAYIGRQSKADIVTIAVETGIQNTAVPIVLLRMSLTGPERATSLVVPLISATLTPIPFVFAILYLEIKHCIQKKPESVAQAEHSDTVSQEVGGDNVENTEKHFSYSIQVDRISTSYGNVRKSFNFLRNIGRSPINNTSDSRVAAVQRGAQAESFLEPGEDLV